MKYRYLYLPIETKTREMDAKLLLAIEAVKRGYIVVIGSKKMRKKLHKLPVGVFFYKDSLKPWLKRFENFKSNGFQIVVHDEEGLVQRNDEDYLNNRVRFETLNYIDLYFCWGEKQKNLVSKAVSEYSANTKLCVSGHPRFDLLRKPISNYNKADRNKIYEHYNYNNIILVNTKLAEYNHQGGEEAWINFLLSHDMIIDNKTLDLRKQQVKYKKLLLFKFQNLIKSLSLKFKSSLIVIRPHPSEDENTWIKFSNDLDNVVVTKKESIGYWLENSDVVIHSSCTTGLEGFVNDSPVISYMPIKDDRFDEDLPNKVSIISTSEIDCVNTVENILGNEFNFKEYKSEGEIILKEYIHNVSGDFSYHIIMNEIDDIYKVKNNNNKFPILKIKIAFAKEKFKVWIIKNILKKFIKKYKYIDVNKRYNKDIKIDEVRGKINLLKKSLNINRDIKVVELTEDVHLIK